MKTVRTVKTILRKDKMKANGECPLYFQIIFNSKVLKLPIGVSLEPKFGQGGQSEPLAADESEHS